MPAEVSGVEPRREAFVEDALKILVPFLVLLSRLALLEEVRRRHLLRVANDHTLLRARDDADRVPHRNLRRLVEDDQVECRFRREILRDRQGAHQEARLYAPDDSARLREQAAYRLLARLLRALAADDSELASVWAVAETPRRKKRREPCANRVLHKLGIFRVEAAELDYLLFALKARERGERRFGAKYLAERRRRERTVERFARLLGIDIARGKRRREAKADPLRDFAGRLAVAHDAARLSHRGDCRVELRGKCAAKALETPDEPGAEPKRAASAEQHGHSSRKASLGAERGKFAAHLFLSAGIPREGRDRHEGLYGVCRRAAPIRRGAQDKLADVGDVFLAPVADLAAGERESLCAAGNLLREAVVGRKPVVLTLVKRGNRRIKGGAVVGNLVDRLLPLVRSALVDVVKRLLELGEDFGLARLVRVELEAERL